MARSTQVAFLTFSPLEVQTSRHRNIEYRMVDNTNIIDVCPLMLDTNWMSRRPAAADSQDRNDSGFGSLPIHHEYPIYPNEALVSTNNCRRYARAVHRTISTDSLTKKAHQASCTSQVPRVARLVLDYVAS